MLCIWHVIETEARPATSWNERVNVDVFTFNAKHFPNSISMLRSGFVVQLLLVATTQTNIISNKISKKTSKSFTYTSIQSNDIRHPKLIQLRKSSRSSEIKLRMRNCVTVAESLILMCYRKRQICGTDGCSGRKYFSLSSLKW